MAVSSGQTGEGGLLLKRVDATQQNGLRVEASRLRWRCAEERLGAFRTTAEVAGSGGEVIGQQRALRALRLGLDVPGHGYNCFVTGLGGTGRSTVVRDHLLSLASSPSSPPFAPRDHLFVHNFRHPDRPRYMTMPGGDGSRFKRDMEGLIVRLRDSVGRLLGGDGHQADKMALVGRGQEEQTRILELLQSGLDPNIFRVVPVPGGCVHQVQVLPVVDGQPMRWREYSALAEKGLVSPQLFEERRGQYGLLEVDLERTLKKLRKLDRELQAEVSQLDVEVVAPHVSGLIQDMAEQYDHPQVHEYLQEVRESVLGAHLSSLLLPRPFSLHPSHHDPELLHSDHHHHHHHHYYKVNLVVDNSGVQTRPVVIERHPSYKNLFGTLERAFTSPMSWTTNFTSIRAGSILKANGGYLVINARDALAESGVWQHLKRTLLHRELELQSPDSAMFSSSALQPQPIPIDLKVVLIGGEDLYHSLFRSDPDFKRIFKVKAHFDSVTNLNEEVIGKYTSFIKKVCDDEKLFPLDRSAVRAVVEHAVRKAGKQSKISTQFQSSVIDVLREAQYWAAQRVSPSAHPHHQQQQQQLINQSLVVASSNSNNVTASFAHFGVVPGVSAPIYPAAGATTNHHHQQQQQVEEGRLRGGVDAVLSVPYHHQQQQLVDEGGQEAVIQEADVDKALAERNYRVSLVQERIQDLISKEKKLIIDVKGAHVGRINGLAVLNMGDFSFGKPTRITASTGLGREGIVNIERESDLSGSSHNKGVLILAGYMCDKFAQNKPLTLSASLCFEQNYGGIDGDSASSTEIYAILSSLAGLPIRQDVAVTGSVNQQGQIQPIGGVNEKIEGFFDVCSAMEGGLTGGQGVVIPALNLNELMLRKDVVEAVQAGRFHIYAINSIDEGIQVLTGVRAGRMVADGEYEEGTVNFLVDRKLRRFVDTLGVLSKHQTEPPPPPPPCNSCSGSQTDVPAVPRPPAAPMSPQSNEEGKKKAAKPRTSKATTSKKKEKKEQKEE
jgi:predicted ATP-dependent protease